MVAAPCSQMFSVKAKQYTKIGFCKHYRREIGGAVTEFSFIFNQHGLVLQFGETPLCRFVSYTLCVCGAGHVEGQSVVPTTAG